MARVVKVSLRTEDDVQQLLGRLSWPGLSLKVVAQKQKLPENASDWQGMPEYTQKVRGCAVKLLITSGQRHFAAVGGDSGAEDSPNRPQRPQHWCVVPSQGEGSL